MRTTMRIAACAALPRRPDSISSSSEVSAGAVLAPAPASPVASAAVGASSSSVSPSTVTAPPALAPSASKARSPIAMSGTDRPKSSSPTMAPMARISSGWRSTIAAGARPASSSSSSTAEPVHEPRPLGIARTAPATHAPCSGWVASMTRALVGSIPPQKERPTVECSSSPDPRPRTIASAATTDRGIF